MSLRGVFTVLFVVLLSNVCLAESATDFQEIRESFLANCRAIDSLVYEIDFIQEVTSPGETLPRSVSSIARSVYICGELTYADDVIDGRLATSFFVTPDECTVTILDGKSKVVQRKPIDDEGVASLPLIDPRDYGAVSGIGSLRTSIRTWTPEYVSANAEAGTVTYRLRSTTDSGAYVQSWVMEFSKEFDWLPISVLHFYGDLLNSSGTISYRECPGSPGVFIASSYELLIAEEPVTEADGDQPFEVGARLTYLLRSIVADQRACERAVKHTIDEKTVVRDSIAGIVGPGIHAVPAIPSSETNWLLIVVNLCFTLAIVGWVMFARRAKS